MHIEDALDRYLLQLRADGRSDHTIRQYRRHVRSLDAWLESEGRDLDVESIDHEVLALFLVSDAATRRPDGQPKKATAMNALRSSVRSFFAYLHAAGNISANPARLIRRARCGTPPPRALSEDEQMRLLDALHGAETVAERRDASLFRLLLGSGLRVGSAVALNVEDVDVENQEITLRSVKGDRPDVLPVPPTVATMLKDFMRERANGPLFLSRRGGRISTRHVQRRFSMWCERAGVRPSASPHTLRHSFATTVYKRTRDVAVVQAALRHRSVMSTLVYVRPERDRVRQALVS